MEHLLGDRMWNAIQKHMHYLFVAQRNELVIVCIVKRPYNTFSSEYKQISCRMEMHGKAHMLCHLFSLQRGASYIVYALQ